jgi:L-seryl-tRNA(Ser) seleniumtransferase
MKKQKNPALLKALPQVERALQIPQIAGLIAEYDRGLIADLVREAIADLREQIRQGGSLPLGPDGKVASEIVAAKVIALLDLIRRPSLRRVVNATGVILHTNLGRAPLGRAAVSALGEAAGYTNLEFELETGERGSRHSHLAHLIRAVTGAEHGIVVNNNAAAVLLCLNTMAADKEVIVSRGELVEIGGAFRIPDIIRRGFARLVEVGTTNRTRLADYRKAITKDTALLLKVHASNYKIVGFTESVSLADLVVLGHERKVPVMEDLGSGLLSNLSQAGLPEPVVRNSLEAGADLVCFSGDKLLGGPQAGIIVGRRDLIQSIHRNPLMRALRPGKLTLLALQAALGAYLQPGRLRDQIPVLDMILRPADELKKAARSLGRKILKLWPEAGAKVLPEAAYAGGGSLPEEAIPTWVVALKPKGIAAGKLAAAFRSAPVPVVGRIKQGVFYLDVRTLLPGDDRRIIEAVREIAERREEKKKI